MTDHYREAENLLDLARAHTDTGDERNQRLAETLTARAQVHALLALVTRPSERAKPAEPKTVLLRDAYATWGDCVIRDDCGDLANVSNGCHIWLTTFGAPIREPHARTTGQYRKAPVTLVERLAPESEVWGEDPWAPGQDVTDRLEAGETAPAGTLLADRDGDICQAAEDAAGSLELLRLYVRALGAEKKQGLFAGPKRDLELGDILFTKDDFKAVPKGHIIVEIVGPENRHFKDGERASGIHYNLFVNDPDCFTYLADTGRFYYLYGGEPVPSEDTEVPLREAFNAWGANAIVEPVNAPGAALTLSPDGAAHFAHGSGAVLLGLQRDAVRLVAVLDDGKVIES